MRSSLKYVFGLVVLSGLLAMQAPFAFAQLNENCTISILNRTANVQSNGSWRIDNVPANFGQVRARATCIENGVTRSGQSDFFNIEQNIINGFNAEIPLGVVDPIPESLTVSAASTTLTAVGATTQLTVTAIFPGGATRDVTPAASGANYTLSNPAVATLSPDGLVTAVSSGTVLVSAMNEGALGVIQLRVVLSGDSDGDGIPDDIEVANGLDPNNPVDALEDGDRDGLTNKEELINFGTNFRVADSDGDGINDGEEVVAGADGFITNPLLADTDGDGIRDGLEIATVSDPTDPASINLAQALASMEVTPNAFTITVNTLIGEASRQLSVTGLLSDGTTIDLTSTARGTNYASSDLSICNFGSQDGEVFVGNDGSCTITVTNSSFSDTATLVVRTFAPTALSAIPIPGYANNVDVNNGFAYVAAGATGLQIVDVSNPSQPVIVGSQDTPGNANDVRVVGALAYVADGSAGLQVIDISDPVHPTIVGSVDTPGEAQDVMIEGTRAYLADGITGLQIIDISNAAGPIILGAVDTPGTAKGVDVSGNIAVVADGFPSSGARFINISNADTPQIVGNITLAGEAKDLVVRDTIAYVVAFTESFQIIDFSIPSNPRVIGGLPVNSFVARDVELSGRFALTAEQLFPNAVPIVDISDPATPIFRTTLDFSPLGDFAGTGIAVTPQFVYMTGESFIVRTENGSSGNTRLFIGQYLTLEDLNGIPPTVSITFPLAGDTLVEGEVIPITVEASDDIQVAAVSFIVDGKVVFTDSSGPFRFNFTVPDSTNSITIGAIAVDLAGNTGTAPDVQLNVAPDPLTTVVGSVVNSFGNPLSGSTVVTANNLTTNTLADGTFVITDVPTVRNLTVTATVVVDGFLVSGSRSNIQPVRDGITNVGQIFALLEPDSDSDGMPDSFELANGFDPDDPTDAGLDADADGLTNLLEFQNRTNPFDADTDDDGLLDGQEVQAGDDPLTPETVPPTVTIVQPLDGSTVIDGATVSIVVDATDNAAVTEVEFFADGVSFATDSDAPYEASFSIPLGVNEFTFGASASDIVGNIGLATDITVLVTSDPMTTAQGTVLGKLGNPVPFADINCSGVTGQTDASGSFHIAGIRTVFGNVRCIANFIDINEAVFIGTSMEAAPVQGGITDVGDIQLASFALLYEGPKFAVGGNPHAVLAVDLDGDNIPDLVTTNNFANDISVLIGNGDGSFTPQQRFAVGNVPIDISASDLNGDMNTDLVVVSNNGGNVSVLLGNGDGTFQTSQLYGTGTFPHAITIEDLNGDDIADLVVTNVGEDNVSVLIGNGDGTFQLQQFYAVGPDPVDVVTGDLNIDGIPDIITANEDSFDVSVLLGNGDGTFQSEQRLAAGDSLISGVAVGDVNGDNIVDLISTHPLTRNLLVFLGNGVGTLGLPVSYRVNGHPQDVKIRDLNGDGLDDLVTVEIDRNNISVLLGNGDGTFQANQPFYVGGRPVDFDIADLNQDGKLDVVASGIDSDYIPVLFGNGDGTFRTAQYHQAGGPFNFAVVRDVNQDAIPDIIVTNEGSDDVSLLLGQGTGAFADQQKLPAGDGPRAPAVADVNGDGLEDIITPNRLSNDVSILLGNGDGTFQPQLRFSAGGSPSSVAVLEANNDGALDLVIVNRDSNDISVLLGVGDGTFTPFQNFAVGSTPLFVAAGDFNLDGNDDVVVANQGSNDFSLMLGNGDGTLAPEIRTSVGFSPGFITAVDVDKDGFLDAVTTNSNSNTVSLVYGNGDGTFAAEQQFVAGNAPTSVAVGDVNSDGRFDLVTSNSFSEDVSVLLRKEDGTYLAQQRFVSEALTQSAALADLDRDGFLDIVTANLSFTGSVTILFSLLDNQ